MQDHTLDCQAELESIYQACKYMDDNYNSIKPRYVKILTDPQAALKSLDSINFKSTIALKTAEAVENLKWRVKVVHWQRMKQPYRARNTKIKNWK